VRRTQYSHADYFSNKIFTQITFTFKLSTTPVFLAFPPTLLTLFRTHLRPAGQLFFEETMKRFLYFFLLAVLSNIASDETAVVKRNVNLRADPSIKTPHLELLNRRRSSHYWSQIRVKAFITLPLLTVRLDSYGKERRDSARSFHFLAVRSSFAAYSDGTSR